MIPPFYMSSHTWFYFLQMCIITTQYVQSFQDFVSFVAVTLGRSAGRGKHDLIASDLENKNPGIARY